METLSKNRLKQLATYKNQKNCDEENLFVVEGIKMCDEALRSGFGIHAICATNEWFLQQQNRIPSSIECYEVNDMQLERLSSLRTPNNVWMLVERPETKSTSSANEESDITLVLDGVQDPGNMGTILRTADWYGIRKVVCSPETVSCYNPKVIQATMGAIFRTEIVYLDIVEWLSTVSQTGITTYGALLDGDNVYETTLRHPAILVVGNESRGISKDVAAIINKKITIPNRGGTCESLNVAIATAILCSEFYR
ncbi:MAG: RNA methyltransferase [Bacteroidales bacterium]|nr:RNA methyltransferase [Bacteroidales bacterium]